MLIVVTELKSWPIISTFQKKVDVYFHLLSVPRGKGAEDLALTASLDCKHLPWIARHMMSLAVTMALHTCGPIVLCRWLLLLHRLPRFLRKVLHHQK